jgi:hypothetical protein
MLKYRREHKNAELILAQSIKVPKNNLISLLDEHRMTILNHPLYNSTAKLIYAVVHQVHLYLLNDLSHLLALRLTAHLYDNLLDDVVAVEVEGALFHAFAIQ